MEQPPVIEAQPVTERKAALGRLGLYFSLAPIAAYAAILVFRPG